ncbi:MAG TPA: N-methyl-L-tryptophan oxidase [Candidatus Baltobacteraceae bacterium]|jgi:sarcosine oxidase|nr:N-methyl-L-tryptophan oxidase [Candidatus Baltobacteraceae bacterium]
MREFDAVVLGLGGIGSGAAYWLARRGARVLGLEQFQLGHARGESHDHSRIIRLSYHSPTYVQLAKSAYAAWAEVEAEARIPLVVKTGGLDLGPRDGAIPLDGYADAMTACGVPFERLGASEIRARYPAFHIGDDVHALFQEDTGIVAAERATHAHQRLAREMGADLRENVHVRSIHNRGAEVEIETDGERFCAGQLVIAAGPWTNHALAQFDMRLPLEITKEQVMYFRPAAPEPFVIGRFPVWIWMDDPSFYGFPIFGEPAVKVTQDAGGQPVDPDTRTYEPDPAIAQRVTGFLHKYLPAALGTLHLVKTCLYTLTPDRDFIVDTLPEHPNVHVAVGAGHAFKFASVIGRILAGLACEGAGDADLQPFALDRPILQMQSPPKTYMV